MRTNSTGNGGSVLLLLATRDTQGIQQLTDAVGLSLEETGRQLRLLTDQGFIVASSPDAAGAQVYRLNPKGTRTEELDRHRRVLLIDDEQALRDVVQAVLEHTGYAVIATSVQADAVSLLQEVAFDLVLTDSFSRSPSGAFTESGAVLEAAGATPVVLFSAHRLELDPAQAAGFAGLLEKPFDIDALARQVRTLIGD